MEKIEILEKRVRQVADRLLTLKDENKKLHSNIKFMEGENKRAGGLIRENDILQEEKKQLAHRVEKVLKKLSAFGV